MHSKNKIIFSVPFIFMFQCTFAAPDFKTPLVKSTRDEYISCSKITQNCVKMDGGVLVGSYSTDGGTTWHPSEHSPDINDRNFGMIQSVLGLTCDTNGIKCLVTGTYRTTEVIDEPVLAYAFTTNDGGKNWLQSPLPGRLVRDMGTVYMGGMACDPQEQHCIVVGSWGGWHGQVPFSILSDNGGLNWHDSTQQPAAVQIDYCHFTYIDSLECDKNVNVCLAYGNYVQPPCLDGTPIVYKTDDRGDTWYRATT